MSQLDPFLKTKLPERCNESHEQVAESQPSGFCLHNPVLGTAGPGRNFARPRFELAGEPGPTEPNVNSYQLQNNRSGGGEGLA